MLANITPNNDAMCLLTAPYTLESLKPGFTQPPALGMHFKSVNTFRSTAPSGYTIGELAIAEPFPTQPVGVYETEGVTGSSGYHAYYRTNWNHEVAKNIRPFVGFWHMPDWFVEKNADGDVVWVGPVEVLFKESRSQREAGLALVKKIKNTMISRVRNAMVLTHPLQNEAPKTYLFVDLIDGVSMSSHLTTALSDLIKSMEHPPHITHIVEADSGIPTDFQGNPVPILVQKILAGLGVAPGQDIVNPETLGWFRMWINNNQHNGRPMLRQDDVSLPQAGFERPYTGEATIAEADSTAEKEILGKPG